MNPPVDLAQRVELAKILLSSGRTEFDEAELAEKAGVALAQPAVAALAALPQIPFPPVWPQFRNRSIPVRLQVRRCQKWMSWWLPGPSPNSRPCVMS